MHKNEKELFQYFLFQWIDFIKPQIKESSYNKYFNLISKHVIPHLGHLLLEQITTERLQNYLLLLLNGSHNTPLSPKTVRDILSIIKRTLLLAQNRGCLVRCNFSGLLPRVQSPQLNILNMKEFQILANKLYDPQKESEIGIMLALFTGVRIGELCALRWGNIHLNEGILDINSTLQRIQDKSDIAATSTKIIISTPKSISSIRKIPLPDFLVSYLEKYKKQDNSYILTGRSDKYMEPRTLENHFKSLLKILNLRIVCFHTLRHTFATRCVEAEFDLKTLSNILGHSNVNITLNRYVHPSEKFKKQNMEKLVTLFPDNCPNTFVE